jgi:hypothetical protein
MIWLWNAFAWVINTPLRIRLGRQRMNQEREHNDYVDQVVNQRFSEMLDYMVKAGEIDTEDAVRIREKIDWDLPVCKSNIDFISLVAQLQQKEGEEPPKQKKVLKSA